MRQRGAGRFNRNDVNGPGALWRWLRVAGTPQVEYRSRTELELHSDQRSKPRSAMLLK